MGSGNSSAIWVFFVPDPTEPAMAICNTCPKKSEEAHSPKTSEPVPYGSTYKQLTTKNMRWVSIENRYNY